jgi:tyrosine-protein kinase Etk/Wzc
VPASNVPTKPSLDHESYYEVDAVPAPISLIELANALLRHRYAILRLGLLGALLAVADNALKPATYSSFAALMPQTARPSNALAGFASQFGLSLQSSDPSQAPSFYVDLVQSAQLLSSLATTSFPDPARRGGTRALVDILEVKGNTPATRINRAVELLRKRIKPSVRQKTGVVAIAVTSNDPTLAAAICTRLLDLVNRFNLETRQSQASAEAQFVQARLTDAKAELRVAEDQLQLFLQRNREFRNSAELAFTEERLRREVTLDQQIVATLSQSYEQARIDRVRDTPAITIVERPVPPPEPDPRHHGRHALLGALLGLVAGALWTWTAEFLHGLLIRREPEIEELHSLMDDSASDVRRPWRLVSRLLIPSRRKKA